MRKRCWGNLPRGSMSVAPNPQREKEVWGRREEGDSLPPSLSHNVLSQNAFCRPPAVPKQAGNHNIALSIQGCCQPRQHIQGTLWPILAEGHLNRRNSYPQVASPSSSAPHLGLMELCKQFPCLFLEGFFFFFSKFPRLADGSSKNQACLILLSFRISQDQPSPATTKGDPQQDQPGITNEEQVVLKDLNEIVPPCSRFPRFGTKKEKDVSDAFLWLEKETSGTFGQG